MLDNLVERLLATGLTDKDRIEKGFNLKVSDIQYAGKIVHGIVSGDKRTHVAAINIKEGNFLCSCEDYSYRKKLDKHIVALIKNVPDSIANEFLTNLELVISSINRRDR